MLSVNGEYLNSGGENINITIMFIELYNIKRTIVFIYNLKAQSLIERGHKFIVDALVKMESL